MVSRNVRNKANSYLYTEKRKFELQKVKEYINAIQTDNFSIKLIKHETILDLVTSKEQEEKFLVDQLFKATELIPNRILTLPKPLKCQSRYIGYRAIVTLKDFTDNGLFNDYSNIRSKHLKKYIKSYVQGTVLSLLIEQERILSVKLHLIEPNEEEMKIRESLRKQNEENRIRNKEIVERKTYIKTNEESVHHREKNNENIQKVTRRKIAKVEDQKRLLRSSKERIKYTKKHWDENKSEIFSCSFTVLYAEAVQSSVIDKLKNSERIYNTQISPEVVSLEKVREWLEYLERVEEPAS